MEVLGSNADYEAAWERHSRRCAGFGRCDECDYGNYGQGGLPSNPWATLAPEHIPLAYFQAGWHPVPLEAGKKTPVLIKGITGTARAAVKAGRGDQPNLTEDEVLEYNWKNRNIAVRFPQGVFGIDVDDYKEGRAGMPALRSLLGDDVDDILETTFVSSKRELPSGIYPFRMPPEWQNADGTWPKLKGAPCAGIEIIQYHHRYAVVAPSKADKEKYRWLHPDGQKLTRPPLISDLPAAPAEWLEPLLKGAPEQDQQEPIASHDSIIRDVGTLLRQDWPNEDIADHIRKQAYYKDALTRHERRERETSPEEDLQAALVDFADNRPTAEYQPVEEQTDWENTTDTGTATGTGTGLPARPEPAPQPDWSPGTPIPIGKRTATVEAVVAWQAALQPTKAALQDYALTHLWPALQQPGEGEDGTRFSKQTLNLKVSAAADRWKSALKDWQQQVKAAQPEEETADPLDYADNIRENLIVCPDSHDRLWRYNPDTGSFIQERTEAAVIKLIAAKAEQEEHLVNMGLISTVLTLLKADPHTISFENPELLAMLNGTLNLATGELLEHSPDHRLPTYIPVEFNPQANYDDWQAFLNQVFPETQEHDLLQQFAGACLPDRTPPRGALFIHGDYASGKSVFLNILIAFLGLWNITAIEPQALKQNHLSAALRGKKANLVSDMSIEAMKDPSGWKQLTGEDPILFNPKFKDAELAFTTCPSGYALNQIPDTWDRTGAVAVRRFIVQTAGTIPPDKRNPQLTAQLTRNLPGIFNWAYQGYKNLIKAGWQWPLSQAQQAQQDKAILLDNPLRRWAAEETEWSEAEHLRTTEAIDEYIHWLIKEKLLDKPDDRTIRKGDDTITIPGQPRLPKPERDRILKELDNIWEIRTRDGKHGHRYRNRRITTYDRKTGTEPAQGRITEDDPEYDKF